MEEEEGKDMDTLEDEDILELLQPMQSKMLEDTAVQDAGEERECVAEGDGNLLSSQKRRRR